MHSISRRQLFKIAGGATAGLALAGCQTSNLFPLESELGPWPQAASQPTWQLLNRITFGPTAEERHRALEIGIAAWVEEQLAPDTLPAMPLRPALTLRRLETLNLDVSGLFDVERETVARELQQAALLRAIYNPQQLYEIMVDFWSDHFNIAQTKGDCAWLKTIDDRHVIRPHALGNFHDLLLASAHSPAMLIYLDNQENLAGNPNENYARELMELHTLGVEGGYTQNDVQELARCLTGWRVKDHFYRGQFTFDPDQHDDGPKQILGLTVAAGVKQNGGEQVIDMLAHHSATARFIATKLVRRFVADTPPLDLVEQATQTFLDTQGDIRAVLRTILLSSYFLTSTPPNAGLKLKRPFNFVASALRQLNARTDAGQPLLKYLAEMGQPLFQWPTPDGYPDYTDAWSGTLLTRWRFALALTNNQISGTHIDWQARQDQAGADNRKEQLNQLAILLLGRALSPTTAEQLLAQTDTSTTLVAALLSAPTFQWT